MPDVNEQIVKDFFEINNFVVSTNWAFPVRTRNVDQYSDFDLVIRNSRAEKSKGKLPFILDRRSISKIEDAVVEVKGWHTERLAPSYLTAHSDWRDRILGFVSPNARIEARRATGVSSPKAILVVSKLAATDTKRRQSEKLLKDAGVDHLLLFDEILEALVESVETKRHYAHSPTLHLLRLLKIYGTNK